MVSVIDANGLVLGRLCTHVAKRLLNGEDVVVVNAENAIVSGPKAYTFEHYRHRQNRGQAMHGPYYPRTPDLILKRTVRNMVDWKKPSGRAAWKRLKVYVGVPRELKDQKAETLESARKTHLIQYTSLGEIAEHMGSKRGVPK